MSEKEKLHKYFNGIKSYIEQIRSIYRLGVCIPAILSPFTLLPYISDLYLAFGSGSVFFLSLLIHYNIKTKMICSKLIVIATLNTIISFTIIFNFFNLQLFLSITTCLLSIYVIFEDEIKKKCKP